MNAIPVLLALGLSLSATPEKDGPKKYTLDLSKTTREVKAGESGFLHLHIKPADGYKVSAEAPLRIKLEADGLALHKTKLGHQDAKDKKSTSPEFGVRFGTTEEGGKAIDVDATFFVCDDKICERKQERVKVAISVKK